MKSHTVRWLPWLVPLAVVALLVAGALRAVQRPRVRLPDGSVLTLEAVTYGEKHTFVYRTVWQKLLGSFSLFSQQPGQVFPGWNHRESVYPLPRKRISLWFVDPGSPALEKVDLLLVDAQGNELPVTPSVGRWIDHYPIGLSPGQPGYFRVSEAAIVQWPRRGSQLRLRLYKGKLKRRIAEFQVANPTSGPHPVWQGKPLPQTRRVGDASITLTELTSYHAYYHAYQEGWRRNGQAVARFTVTHRGRTPCHWEVSGRATAEDATRNWVGGYSGEDVKGKRAFAHFFRGLLPDRSAWKLRIPFTRTEHARFTPEETWTVHDVAVPRPRSFTRCSASIKRRGAWMQLLGIWGVGFRDRTGEVPGRGIYPLGQPLVRVRWRSLPEGCSLFLYAVDERGRRYRSSGVGYVDLRGTYPPRRSQSGLEEDTEYHFPLDLPRGVPHVDLQVIFNQARYVEFLAHPRWVEPASRTP
jgi:hypothetical protein